MSLHPNYRFIVAEVSRLASPGATVLDYGCGSGEVVQHARAQGVDMVGADIFYAGSEARAAVECSGQLGRSIFAMPEGRIPFPDKHFDLVCANQVFEHVRDIDLALSEIRRVLKPGGIFLNIFPSLGTLRECHCGVPFAHWFVAFPRLLTAWLFVWRSLGFGYFIEGRSRAEWAANFSRWLRAYTIYRPVRTIYAAYSPHFGGVKHAEHQLAAFRLDGIGWHRSARLALRYTWPSRVLLPRLASMVLIARRNLEIEDRIPHVSPESATTAIVQ